MISYHKLRDEALECVATVTSSINICSASERKTDIEKKSSSSDYVTSLDRQIESGIVQFIRKNRANDGILGEEGASRSGTSGIRWIIDPIDGTSNFVYSIPYFSISIAIEAEGEIVAGVVADLSSNDIFDAVKGHGSRCNNEVIKVNDNDSLQSAIVTTGFSYRPERREFQGGMLQHILPRIGDIRRFGSAALDLCWLATGRVDAFYEEGLNLWDYAAGSLIVSEAGGTVRTVNLAHGINLLLATNAHLDKEFQILINNALQH
ncbi:MAG: inositol monophosphatase family protein [Acidimicrobiales bacterium]|jgi:myo-inositol-1(or 4)-monophosphatase|nr:inositol monophosphatase family protein [Acidimicrobiales bacterium]|tara:strand:+ start:49 stop:837 length:789 start_codon:yes stop_codon:yes gene_type:complete